jgi:hypothetical protein
MISDEDMRRFAEYLVRLCESEIAAGKVLPDGDDNQHCHDDTAGHPEGRRNKRTKQINYQPIGIGLAAFEVLPHLWVLMIGLANTSARLLERR